MNSDIQDWNITFVDTGASASVGQRLRAVSRHLEGEDVFLANYTDGLTDLHLPDLIELWEKSQATASFLSVRPTQSFHTVTSRSDGTVVGLRPIGMSDVWMNGGFFIMSTDMLKYIRPGEDLVSKPFERLVVEGQLTTLHYDGFWSCMDTYKEKQSLDEMFEQGDAPWMVWKRPKRRRTSRRLGIVLGGSNSRKTGT